MTLQPLFPVTQQFQNKNGSILVAGRVYVYYKNRTALAEIFSDEEGTVVKPNPVLLDNNGRATVFANTIYSYTIVVCDYYGKELFSQDITLHDAISTAKDVIVMGSNGTVKVDTTTLPNGVQYDMSVNTDIIATKESVDKVKTDLNTLTGTVNNHTTQIGKIQEDIVGIESTVVNKKDKQTELAFNGSATKTVKSITQNVNGELNVEFADIALPQEVPNVEITSEDKSIKVSETTDVQTNTKKFDLSVQDGGTTYSAGDAIDLTNDTISVKYGKGLEITTDNKLQLKVGQGLTLDNDSLELTIKDLETSITDFRTGDVIPVDGPDGTAKMSKDDLLKESAENTLSSIKSIGSDATDADLKDGNYFAIDGAEGTKRLSAKMVEKASDVAPIKEAFSGYEKVFEHTSRMYNLERLFFKNTRVDFAVTSVGVTASVSCSVDFAYDDGTNKMFPVYKLNEYQSIILPKNCTRIRFYNNADQPISGVVKVIDLQTQITENKKNVSSLELRVPALSSEVADKADKAKFFKPLEYQINVGTFVNVKDYNGSSYSQTSARNIVMTSGFSAGDTIYVSGYSDGNDSYGLIGFFNSSQQLIRTFYKFDENYSRKEFVIPEGTAEIRINGWTLSMPAVEYLVEVKNLDDVVNDIDKEKSWFDWYNQNIFSRLNELQKSVPFSLNVNRPVLSFVFDDTMEDIKDVEDLFASKNVPCCFATIPDNLRLYVTGLTITRESVLLTAQSNGCEILVHGREPLTSESTDEQVYNLFVGNKKTLADKGFVVDGIIEVGGTGYTTFDTQRCEKYLKDLYRYSDGYGRNLNLTQFYSNNRKWLSSNLATNKGLIDAAVIAKRWDMLSAHGVVVSGGIGLQVLSDTIDYAISQGCEILTMRNVYNKYSNR